LELLRLYHAERVRAELKFFDLSFGPPGDNNGFVDVNDLKGRVAEALVESILRRAAYRVARVGRESQVHGLVKIGPGDVAPDFLVWRQIPEGESAQPLHRLFPIDVKYRSNLREFVRKELEPLVAKVGDQWPELYCIVVTAENLKKTLTREMRKHHRKQLDELLGKLSRALADKGPRREGREPRGLKAPLAPYLSRLRRPRRLKSVFKGREYRARVRNNGQIKWKKRIYNSPSLVAHAVTGRPTNGWPFWTYERAPHDWAGLHELRH